MRQGLIVAAVIAALCAGCTKKRPKQNESQATAGSAQAVQPTSPVQAAAKAPGCENGTAPNVIAGNCQGKWNLVNGPTGQVCEYVWGPAVKCPAGSKALGNDTVCYGVTGKAVEGEKLKSFEGCIQKFGVQPISPKYTLSCCSI